MNIGDKIEYLVGDKWKKGVIHGIKSAEATEGPDIILGYLVDTGKDHRIDEIHSDQRDDAVREQAQAIVDDRKNPINDLAEAAADVVENGDLPKSKVVVEKIRQPEQVEVLPDNIRPAK